MRGAVSDTLKVSYLDALVDAPPEVLLAFAAPGEDRHARLRQRRRHLVLRRVDVARRPAHLLDRVAITTTTVNFVILQYFLTNRNILKEDQWEMPFVTDRFGLIYQYPPCRILR